MKTSKFSHGNILITICIAFLFVVALILVNRSNSQKNSTYIAPSYNANTSTYTQKQGGDIKPFWTGTSTLQVCKKPYYSSSECAFLPTRLINSNSVEITFDDGAILNTSGLTCYKGGNYTAGDGYVFCRSYDSSGGQWDIFPVSVKL